MIRRVPAILLATVVGAFLAVPAFAGEAPVNIQGSTKADRGYSSLENASIKEGKSRLLYMRVTNTTNSTADVSLEGESFSNDGGEYKVDWYRGKKPDKQKRITQSVEGGAYGFVVKRNDSVPFVAKVKNKGADDSTLCLRGGIVTAGGSSFDSVLFSINGDTACLR